MMLDHDGLIALLRERCKAEGSANRFAANHDICQGYVASVLNGWEKPGPQIALALGFKKIIRFVPIT
jgi:hypothetical protein